MLLIKVTVPSPTPTIVTTTPPARVSHPFVFVSPSIRCSLSPCPLLVVPVVRIRLPCLYSCYHDHSIESLFFFANLGSADSHRTSMTHEQTKNKIRSTKEKRIHKQGKTGHGKENRDQWGTANWETDHMDIGSCHVRVCAELGIICHVWHVVLRWSAWFWLATGMTHQPDQVVWCRRLCLNAMFGVSMALVVMMWSRVPPCCRC